MVAQVPSKLDQLNDFQDCSVLNWFPELSIDHLNFKGRTCGAIAWYCRHNWTEMKLELNTDLETNEFSRQVSSSGASVAANDSLVSAKD